MTLASWDLETGLRIRKHLGHEEVINSIDLSKRGAEMLVSASDDGCIGVGLSALRVRFGDVLISF
jgi:Prp8 binding protein